MVRINGQFYTTNVETGTGYAYLTIPQKEWGETIRPGVAYDIEVFTGAGDEASYILNQRVFVGASKEGGDVVLTFANPEAKKSYDERIAELEGQNAMLTECLLEMSEIIYA